MVDPDPYRRIDIIGERVLCGPEGAFSTENITALYVGNCQGERQPALMQHGRPRLNSFNVVLFGLSSFEIEFCIFLGVEDKRYEQVNN